jgi:hypothetical protein
MGYAIQNVAGSIEFPDVNLVQNGPYRTHIHPKINNPVGPGSYMLEKCTNRLRVTAFPKHGHRNDFAARIVEI